jgi:hypothetical protein
VFAGVPVIQPRPYMPVFLKFTSFNLNDSFYNNPTNINGPEINLMLWTMNTDDFKLYEDHMKYSKQKMQHETKYMAQQGTPVPATTK